MTNSVITDLKNVFSKLETLFAPAVHKLEVDAKAIGTSALSYIETNGLTALYNIATGVLLGAAMGTPWAVTLATVVKQGEVAGLQIAKGAEAVVVAQAQADLLAAGQLLPAGSAIPVANAVLAPVAAS